MHNALPARRTLCMLAAAALAACGGRGTTGAGSTLPRGASANARGTSAVTSSTPPNQMPDSPPLATTSALTYGLNCTPRQIVSAGGYSSCNIQWLGHINLNGGETIGGHYVAATKTYFVTNFESGEYAFDASAPEHPVLESNLKVDLGNVPAGATISTVENEDTATNGRVLFLSRTPYNDAIVLDVHDPKNMKLLATVPNGPAHTQNCLDDCQWDYGSTTGAIIDARNPAAPILESNRWTTVIDPNTVTQNPAGNGPHDATEIRPGLLATASNPVNFIDTTNPAQPKLLFHLTQTAAEPTPVGIGPAQSGHVGHSVQWPRSGKDRWFLGQSEGVYIGRCEEFPNDGRTLYAYDTHDWQSRHDFALTGAYTLVMGNAAAGTGGIEGVDGNGNPSTVVVGAPEGCSAHWFDVNPHFNNGGLVALSAFAFGVRLLNVAENGHIQQVGWFVPSGLADTVGVHWAGDRVMYVLDFETGGMDIIKYTGPLPNGPLKVSPVTAGGTTRAAQ